MSDILKAVYDATVHHLSEMEREAKEKHVQTLKHFQEYPDSYPDKESEKDFYNPADQEYTGYPSYGIRWNTSINQLPLMGDMWVPYEGDEDGSITKDTVSREALRLSQKYVPDALAEGKATSLEDLATVVMGYVRDEFKKEWNLDIPRGTTMYGDMPRPNQKYAPLLYSAARTAVQNYAKNADHDPQQLQQEMTDQWRDQILNYPKRVWDDHYEPFTRLPTEMIKQYPYLYSNSGNGSPLSDMWNEMVSTNMVPPGVELTPESAAWLQTLRAHNHSIGGSDWFSQPRAGKFPNQFAPPEIRPGQHPDWI